MNIYYANLFKNLGTVGRKVEHIIIGISLAETACKQGKGYKHDSFIVCITDLLSIDSVTQLVSCVHVRN